MNDEHPSRRAFVELNKAKGPIRNVRTLGRPPTAVGCMYANARGTPVSLLRLVNRRRCPVDRHISLGEARWRCSVGGRLAVQVTAAGCGVLGRCCDVGSACGSGRSACGGRGRAGSLCRRGKLGARASWGPSVRSRRVPRGQVGVVRESTRSRGMIGPGLEITAGDGRWCWPVCAPARYARGLSPVWTSLSPTSPPSAGSSAVGCAHGSDVR